MKKSGLILAAVLALVAAAMCIYLNIGGTQASGNVSRVTARDQASAEENDLFTTTEYVPVEIAGTNVARKGLMTSNGFTDVYPATNANDGSSDATCYWEGPSGEDAILTVNLKKAYNVGTIRLTLNPNPIWGARTQTMSINISDDGENFTELIPEADYVFDPDTHNEIILSAANGDFSEFKAQYVQLVITKNTGAKSGQIAEFEVYSED